MRARSVAIAGAGLSGFAVALALRERGFLGSIEIVDQKASFENDRTWCWWDVPGIPFADAASYRWNAFCVADAEFSATAVSRSHAYLHLRGCDYYAASLTRLVPTGVHVELGERVLAIVDGAADARILTDRRTVVADVVIDARGTRASANLHQHFFGLHVVTDAPAFDPTTVTLMDFRAASSGLHFAYVLPYSRYEALVEDTIVDDAAPDFAAGRRRTEAYLLERFGIQAFAERRCEWGAIPIDPKRLSTRVSAHVLRAGIAAGATRASSGYTYVRTHQHAKAIAAWIVDGVPLPAAGSPQSAFLDATFLYALRHRNFDLNRVMVRLFERVPGKTLARFLSDNATLCDHALIIGAIASALPEALARQHAAERPERTPSTALGRSILRSAKDLG